MFISKKMRLVALGMVLSCACPPGGGELGSVVQNPTHHTHTHMNQTIRLSSSGFEDDEAAIDAEIALLESELAATRAERDRLLGGRNVKTLTDQECSKVYDELSLFCATLAGQNPPAHQ